MPSHSAARATVAIAVFMTVLLALAPVDGRASTERVDETVVAAIKLEGFQNSEVMDTLSWLSDVYGPRLTGSDNLRRAAEWARDRMKTWGLANAALEPYAMSFRGWTLERFSLDMIEPQYMRIYGYPMAWSPPLAAPLTGTPIVVDIKSKADFDKYRGKLRGAVVMNGRPGAADIGFTPEAERLDEAALTKRSAEISPGTPASLQEEDEDFNQMLDSQIEIQKFFASEGVAAVITASSIREDVRVSGYYDHKWHAPFPSFVFSREHYGRLIRMLDKKIPVTLSLSLSARFTDNVEGFNVVAEIPGSDPQLRSQVVMLGGHLDSWHTGTGATDNGAGCAAAMEAVRILQSIGVKPRRTIRVALWSGEEQDYFGSRGYVARHFGNTATGERKPEHATLAAYFNLDNGAGRIRGINLQGNEAARPIFEEWLRPFAYLGATTVTTLNSGGTDHVLFNAVGLPGFQFIQDPLNYGSRTHHSSLDVYEEAPPDDLKQASVILASFVYHAAMRDDMLPRPKLAGPHK
jgi:carboxypeptidase Q